MPMGDYENWDACMEDQRKKGHSEESATKICGYIKKQTEEKFVEETPLKDKRNKPLDFIK